MNKIILGTLLCGGVAFGAVNLGACKGCHGQNFEKVALGKSKIVKDMKVAEVEKVLLGYKTGTYGGSMAGLMKGQVAKYSDKELVEVANLVGKK